MEEQDLDSNIDDVNGDIEPHVDSEQETLEKMAGLLEEKDPATVEPPVVPVIPEPPTELLHKVKIDGVEKEVTLDELKSSFMRQSDYTQKTQALSEERQQVQAAAEQYQQYLQAIPVLAGQAQQNLQKAQQFLQSPQMIELAKTDPAEYIAQKAQCEAFYAENVNALNQMQQQHQEYQKNQSDLYNATLKEVMAKSNELLEASIPNWKEPATKKAIADYGVKSGLTMEEVNGLYDHRYVNILNKARLYDDLVANQGAATQRVQNAPPRVLQPGTSNQFDAANDFQTRKAKAIKSGDEQAIIRLMAEML